ncbi:MAG: NAD(P)-dependent oxidoreductase [Candidatus Omnitrophica bacterium]|nr:NAD(P)-dependent oxidoreductase [Candidatus Omnitrophota bacterium]
MNVVVFGGSGFVGSHVADALTDSGHKVTVFDIKPSKYLRDSQKMIVGDILDQAKVESAVKSSDVVYNFAGIADINEASNRPLDSVKYNILGNSIILEACRKYKTKRLIFASSLYVYSKSGNFYRSTKQACELLIENYHEIFNLNYTILRYGSLYGPRADEGNFIYKIIKQAFIEGKITREGDGEELREYIHVLDAAKGSVEILADEFANQHVIITGNQQMRIKDLLFMIREIMDNKIGIEFVKPDRTSHYELTPYCFRPRVGKRLNCRTYLDLNQGILDIIYNVDKEVKNEAILLPVPRHNG